MFRIIADNPKGLKYDLTFEDGRVAYRQVQHLIARGAKNITVNGKPYTQEA